MFSICANKIQTGGLAEVCICFLLKLDHSCCARDEMHFIFSKLPPEDLLTGATVMVRGDTNDITVQSD